MTIASYHISKLSTKGFDETVEDLVKALAGEGFGIITRIDMKETLKKKLNVDFRNYLILGACNPRFAYEALMEEDKIGVFLPCNVVVQEHDNGKVEVSALDPEEMMRPAGNLNLSSFATDIKQMLTQALKKI